MPDGGELKGQVDLDETELREALTGTSRRVKGD